MLSELAYTMMYAATFLSLFLVDYLLGNGFVDMFQRMFCKVLCFVRKSIREEEKQIEIIENDSGLSLPFLIVEVVFLGFTVVFLNKYKQMRGKDRIDDLLQESREALKQTNEFLEKWRLRRINWQVPNEYTYLDDEPQEIKPFKLEVPILHMAIIDTLGTSRNQLERGDGGDTINMTDSTLLSMTSLLGDDSGSATDVSPDNMDDSKNIEIKNRYLWDVMEEDASFDD